MSTTARCPVVSMLPLALKIFVVPIGLLMKPLEDDVGTAGRALVLDIDQSRSWRSSRR